MVSFGIIISFGSNDEVSSPNPLKVLKLKNNIKK